MTIAPPLPRPRRTVEHRPGVAGLGWRVCVGHRATGCVSVLRGADRLRVVVAEPLSDTCPRGVRERLESLAGDLLVAGAGLSESVDRLARQVDEDRRTAPQAGLILVDLLAGGHVHVVCRYAPSAVHLAAGGLALVPDPPGTGEATTRLAPGEHLLAYSGTFLEAVPPGILASLPGHHPDADSCTLWQALASAADQGTGRTECTTRAAAPDLAVITRTA